MEPVWALGLMSGTSFDGVDAACLLTDGETVSGFGPGAEFPYAPGEMDAARAVLPPGVAVVSEGPLLGPKSRRR